MEVLLRVAAVSPVPGRRARRWAACGCSGIRVRGRLELGRVAARRAGRGRPRRARGRDRRVRRGRAPRSPTRRSWRLRCGGYDVLPGRRCWWATRPRPTWPAPRRPACARCWWTARAPPPTIDGRRAHLHARGARRARPGAPPPASLTDATLTETFETCGYRPPTARAHAGTTWRRRLTASKGFIGLRRRDRGASSSPRGIVAIPFALAGADLDSGGFIIVGTFVQDLVMIAAAYFVTADLGRPTARTFGLRPFSPSAFGWIFVALVAYLVADRPSTRCSSIRRPSSCPSGSDADRACSWRSPPACSDRRGAVRGGVLLPRLPVPGVSQQLRRAARRARCSALIFGAIHFEFFKLVQLAILGVILALLFEKTRSLWPPHHPARDQQHARVRRACCLRA